MATYTLAPLTSSASRPGQSGLAVRSLAVSDLLAIPDLLQICVSNGLVQSVGQRMQAIAVAWLVLEMSDSAFWLGIINGVPAISVVIFSLVGGVIADRLEARSVLVASRVALSLTAVSIALLAATVEVQIGHLLVYMLIVVGIAAVDMPVSRTLLRDTAGNGRLISATAAQSAFRDVFNIAVPVAMGLLIGAIGSDAAFWVLAAAYAVAALLLRTRVQAESAVPRLGARLAVQGAIGRHSPPSHRHRSSIAEERPPAKPLADVLAGLAYIRTDPCVAALVLLAFLVPVAGIYFAMMPVYAREVLNAGAGGLGVLAGSFSAGSLLGSLYLTLRSGMNRRSSKLTLAGAAFGAGMMAFGLSDSFAVSCVVSFLMGVSAGFWLNLLTSLVQLVSVPEMRGRVVSVSSMAYQLIGLGWLMGGILASLVGLEATLLAGGIIFAGGSIAVFAASQDMRAIG